MAADFVKDDKIYCTCTNSLDSLNMWRLCIVIKGYLGFYKISFILFLFGGDCVL